MTSSSRNIATNPTFDAAFAKKSSQLQKRTLKTIRLLAANPQHPSLQCHRVKSAEGVWEAYVDRRRFRLTFEYMENGDILLLNNCTHSILP